MIVECDQKKWSTKKKIKKQLNPLFNEEFRFDLQKKTKEQLEDLTIKFIVVDSNALGSDTVIGSYEMDLTSIYFSFQHEYFNVWLTLTDPTDEVEGIMGYLYVDVCLMGPSDEMPVHDISQAKKPGDNKDKALTPGKIQQQGHLINVRRFSAASRVRSVSAGHHHSPAEPLLSISLLPRPRENRKGASQPPPPLKNSTNLPDPADARA